MIGQVISRYKILDKLGEGGMGAVYQAEDTTLGRPVALKFLASHLLNDDEAKQRFLREAKAAAAITHPNICHVYEVGQTDGKTFLAMAYLEGESLEERIAKGPLPLKDALDIGRQVAEGLAAAHAKGIVHRDVKPANLMVSPDGRATIMDFGLARLTEASKLTKADQTVGTAAYMSPEQMQGGEVDQRTDIWALGCVLYEMVAGVRPFPGQYDQALAYEIVNQEPEPLTAVRAGVPMELEFIVGKCLAKEPANRYGSAEETVRDLRTLAEKLKSGRSLALSKSSLATRKSSLTVDPLHLPPNAVLMSRTRRRALYGLTALFGIGLFGVLAVHVAETGPEETVKRFSFTHLGVGKVSISPNGRIIVYSAIGEEGSNSSEERESDLYGVWLRPLDSETVHVIPGTEGSLPYVDGWSPDSRSIIFAAGGRLKRIDITGGDPITLCDLPAPPESTYRFLGATWSSDAELIVFSSGLKLWQVSGRGGEPKLVFEPDSDSYYWSPRFLPTGNGSRHLVYTVARKGARRIELLDLDTGERKEMNRPGKFGGRLIRVTRRALDNAARRSNVVRPQPVECCR